LPCVWICRLEVGRKGGAGGPVGRRERVVEIVEGARVEGWNVDLVATVLIEGVETFVSE
jgi:hypothetical protein